jgi:ribosomal protein S27AE
MATYSVERLNWKCMVCGATNNIGPCPNCGNRKYRSSHEYVSGGAESWKLKCTECGYDAFENYVIGDPRLTCAKCGKFTPLSKSGLELSRCFIATATYGSPYAREVEILRRYRDNYLQCSVLGQYVIRLYELLSPPLANWIAQRPRWRQFVREFIMSPLLGIAQRQIRGE